MLFGQVEGVQFHGCVAVRVGRRAIISHPLVISDMPSGVATSSIMVFLHHALEEFIVNVDCARNQFIQSSNFGSVEGKFILHVVFESAVEHDHEGVVIPSCHHRVVFELRGVLGGRSFLFDTLDHSNCHLVLIGQSKNPFDLDLELGITLHPCIDTVICSFA